MGLASWFRNIFSKKETPLPHFSIDQVEIIHINPNDRKPEDMVAFSNDPLDPLNMAIKYKTLDEYHHSQDFLSNIDKLIDENGKWSETHEIIRSYILNRDKLKQSDGGYGEEDFEKMLKEDDQWD